MPTKTRRTTEAPIRLVKGMKMITRGNMAGPNRAARTKNVSEVHPMGRKENRSEAIPIMAKGLAAAETVKDKEKASSSQV